MKKFNGENISYVQQLLDKGLPFGVDEVLLLTEVDEEAQVEKNEDEKNDNEDVIIDEHVMEILTKLVNNWCEENVPRLIAKFLSGKR